MKIREILAKTILSKSKIFDWTINPYIGCQYGCTYCYARFIKRFTGHKEEWGEFIDVRINAPKMLEKEIKKKEKGNVWISGICDPYQPIEGKYQLTRKCLEILLKYQWSVTIQTKSPLVLKDLDLLKKFKEIEVGFTITTSEDDVRKIFEPKAPPIQERIRALEKIHNEGIKTFAMVAPVLPGAKELFQKLKGKVDYVILDRMNYHYADWVYQKYNFKKTQNLKELVKLFEKENIPARIC
jgi:DNA repair photolyase